MNELADASQRRLALDPGKSFHLEAPAGSGKTWLLAARFLRLLGVVANPQQILALTFTKKAAGEMRERITACLARAKRGETGENEADRELLALAAAALRRHKDIEPLLTGGELLRVQTFHSFCHAVVSQAPLEAGVSPGSALIDENDQKLLIRQVIGEALGEISGRGPDDPVRIAFENRLLYLNNSWRALANELSGLMDRRETLLDLVEVLRRDRATGFLLDRTRELAETELAALKTEFERCALGLSWEAFAAHMAARGAGAAGVLPRRVPSAAWEDLDAWAAIANTLLTQGGTLKKQPGEKAGFYAGFSKTEWHEKIHALTPLAVERLGLVRSLPLKDSAAGGLESLFDLVLLVHAVMDAWAAWRRRARLLDFAELELAALHLFNAAGPSDLQLVLDHQIRHILIDEFQDTSRAQWELLRRLCAGWIDGDGRTLFLVGDPKQSIYSFRKAEVSLFMEAKGGVPIEGGSVLPIHPLVLETNFRSQPRLIAWCNAIFGGTVMKNPRPEFDEVAFEPSVPAPGRDWPEDPPAPGLALFCESPDSASARKREAEWLAGAVSERVRAGGGQDGIGILLFTRTHLPVYLEALQRMNVAVQVKEGIKLSERPEVHYLWQLCRAMVLPHDHLAWAAQLRSPWLCLSFDEIDAICRCGQDGWVERIRAHAEKSEAVSAFWEKLQEAWPRLAHEPLAEVAGRAWVELGGARAIAGLWGSRGINCCLRFFELLRKAEENEPVRTLMRAEELLENAYEPVDPDAASSKVFVMTVHGAKGLEFDSVFIPFMDYGPVSREKKETPPYVLERVTRSGGHLLAVRPDRLSGKRDALYDWLRRLQWERRFGEARRLFYVAATRARSELLMSGVLKSGKNGFAFPQGTPLDWLNAHYGLSEAVGLQEVRQEQWQSADRGFTVRIEPPGAGTVARAVRAGGFAPPEIRQAPFERERPPFSVLHPSSLAKGPPGPDELAPGQAGPDADPGASAPCSPRTWGILIHRLLAAHGKEGAPPSIEKIGAWLVRQGIGEREASGIAEQAASEVDACLDDPWLRELFRAPAADRFVEWPVECVGPGRVLYSGVIDLAVFRGGKDRSSPDPPPAPGRTGQRAEEQPEEGAPVRTGGVWKLIDFKTSRPASGETEDELCRRELEKYAPQVAAYREMWAKMKGIGEGSIDTFLYWTALRKRLPCP